MKIQKIALIGAGAVGSYFIWGFADRKDLQFAIIASDERKLQLEQKGISINGEPYIHSDLHPVCIATPEDFGIADLILISTKYGALTEAARMAAIMTGPHTIVMSLLNGVDSEEVIAEQIDSRNILYSEMQIASRRIEHDIRFVPERTPGVFFGEKDGSMETDRLKALNALFHDTKINYHICPNILQEIWLKMAFNVSMNLPQAILGCTIDGYVKSEHMKQLRLHLREEVRQIAAAEGIDITEWSAIEKMEYPSLPSAKYSTLQDIEAGRKTEIDMFSGTLMRLGKKHGIPTPYNEFTYHAIRAREEINDGLFE